MEGSYRIVEALTRKEALVSWAKHTLRTGRKKREERGDAVVFANDDHGQVCSEGRSQILCSRYVVREPRTSLHAILADNDGIVDVRNKSLVEADEIAPPLLNIVSCRWRHGIRQISGVLSERLQGCVNQRA